jgi:aspartate-semialdehyde dehydrogenase
MEELITGTQARLNGETIVNNVFVHALPFNLIPHIDKFQVGDMVLYQMSIFYFIEIIFY